MNDIIIIKSLEDSVVLIDGVTETVKQWNKKLRRQIYWNFVSTFSHFNRATSDFFSSKGISGRRIRRAGIGYMDKKI